MRDGFSVDFGLCRIWRDHGRDFSWITSGSDGIPSDPVGIDRDPEFLSRWITVNPVGISPGSQRDPVGISSGSGKIPSFYPAGIPVNPNGIQVNPDGIPVNPDGIPTISRWNPTKSRQNPVGIRAGSHRDLGGIPPGSRRDPSRDPEFLSR